MPPSWHDVAVIVATLAALLVAQFAAVLWSRYGARSTADVHRQARSERIVEREEAKAERDVREREATERAAAQSSQEH
jgi:hypothetical protein